MMSLRQIIRNQKLSNFNYKLIDFIFEQDKIPSGKKTGDILHSGKTFKIKSGGEARDITTVAVRNADGSISASFTVAVKAFSTSVFNTYSVASGTFIRTYMTIAGLNSGVSTQKEINISQT